MEFADEKVYRIAPRLTRVQRHSKPLRPLFIRFSITEAVSKPLMLPIKAVWRPVRLLPMRIYLKGKPARIILPLCW